MTLAKSSPQWEILNVSIQKSYFRASVFRKYIIVEGRASAKWAGEDHDRPLVDGVDFLFTYTGRPNESPDLLIENLKELADIAAIVESRAVESLEKPTLESYVRERYVKLDSTLESDKPTIVPPPTPYASSTRTDSSGRHRTS